MSFRTVYGYSRSENGWRMCDRNECDIVRIPDLYLTETAPLRKGSPLTILGAWLYWYDRNVEEILTSVWGWSATNDVANSNHLSGTAVDVNAPKYPWGARVMPAARKAKIREGLKLFEGTVFWGADWTRADEMHYQMAFPEGDGRNNVFAAKLRNGHLGIYKPAPAGPYRLDTRDGYVRRIIAVGRSMGISPRGIVIAIATGLVESNIKVYSNRAVPESMRLPYDAVGSDGKSVGIFQQQVVMGNGWWWGDAEACMNPEKSARMFFERLAKCDYNRGDAGAHAQAIQQSAFPTRYSERMGEAQQLYDRLAATTPTDGGFLMALTDKEQKELLTKTRVIYDQLGPKHPAWTEASSFGKDAAGNELTMRDGLIKKLDEIAVDVSKLGGKK